MRFKKIINRMMVKGKQVNELKAKAAMAALEYLDDHLVIGVGTGSTVHYFIDELAKIKSRIEACVASSEDTKKKLQEKGIPVIDLNVADTLPIYIDGADEVNPACEMIKGGGGALTREKILAHVAQQFICIVDETKYVKQLGAFPVAVEVLPIARSFVARSLVQLGGNPVYREGMRTDNGNIILDVYDLDLSAIEVMENRINQIPGVLDNGLFAARKADVVLIANPNQVQVLTSS